MFPSQRYDQIIRSNLFRTFIWMEVAESNTQWSVLFPRGDLSWQSLLGGNLNLLLTGARPWQVVRATQSAPAAGETPGGSPVQGRGSHYIAVTRCLLTV